MLISLVSSPNTNHLSQLGLIATGDSNPKFLLLLPFFFPPPMSDSDSEPYFDRPSSTNIISSKLVISAIVFFFVVVIFVAILDLLARRRWGAGTAYSHHPRRRRSNRSRLVFHADRDAVTAPSRGLSSEILEALPIRIYRSSDLEETTECAVCLSELDDGEKIRLLPSCRHCFHVDCIDMWFHSHSTCPLCRNCVTAADGEVAVASCDRNETSEFSTNGSGAPLVSAVSSNTSLVIEIPRRGMDAFTSPTSSSLSTSRRVEEMKSPARTSATPSRLRSLKRLVSRDRRGANVSSCSSPYAGDSADLEMGLVGTSTTVDDGSGGGKGSHKNL